ncbi:hypothetical protein ACFY9G_22095 [Streptomyces anthocyanicus]|uniref:hypothetical protein n=1 Tax=Streptomyces anthocyanicus TaxID=68174 RepID=UPI0036E2B1A6
MDELWIALIAAGSAVLGSLVTGWLTRSAGLRQAEAAKHAGDRQADAALHIMQATLDEQRRARREDRRRQTYVEFLKTVDELVSGATADQAVAVAAVLQASTKVTIEGPRPVVRAASDLMESARARGRDGDGGRTFAELRAAYFNAVQDALR